MIFERYEKEIFLFMSFLNFVLKRIVDQKLARLRQMTTRVIEWKIAIERLLITTGFLIDRTVNGVVNL